MDLGCILKPADILAIKKNRGFGKGIGDIIKDITKQEYSHIAIVGRDELHVFEAIWTGIRYREIRNRFGDFDVFRHPNISPKQVSTIISYCSKRINLGYDYAELLSYVFHGLKHFENPKKYICSGLAYEAYLSAGIQLVEHPGIIVTPGDIAESPQLVKVNGECSE